MTGSDLRELLRTHNLPIKAVAADLGVCVSAISKMMIRADVGAINAAAIRYIIHYGGEERMLEPGEVLPIWGSNRKALSACIGMSAKQTYLILSGKAAMTPRFSMAVRQAVLDRDARRAESLRANQAIFLAQSCSAC